MTKEAENRSSEQKKNKKYNTINLLNKNKVTVYRYTTQYSTHSIQAVSCQNMHIYEYEIT